MSRLILTVYKDRNYIDYKDMTINQRINFKGYREQFCYNKARRPKYIYQYLLSFVRLGSCVTDIKTCERLKLD